MVVQLVADAKLIMVYFHSLFRELRQRSPERVGLWCRIKRIGKSQPAIDAGSGAPPELNSITMRIYWQKVEN